MNPARDLEAIMLHARESQHHPDYGRDEIVAMKGFAEAVKGFVNLSSIITHTSPRADQNMEELACLLAEIGSDMHAHFTREPPSPVELMRADQDHNSKMMREDAA